MTVVDMSPPELPALRFHQLRRIGQSPAHYKAAIEQGDPAPSGTALHSVLLGGKRLAKWDRQTDAGKSAPRNGQYWESFKRDNPDALILTPSEYAETAGMVAAVRANDDAMSLLQGALEQSLYWDALGRRCRGTPDVLGASFVTELKSARTTDPRRFKWDAIKLAYHVQLAWYVDGAARLGKVQPNATAHVVAVENSAPYVVTVFDVEPADLELGRRTYRSWLELLQACEDADHWPGYVQCRVPLGVAEAIGGESFEAEEAA